MMKVFEEYRATARAATASWAASVAIVAGRAMEWIPPHFGSAAFLTVGFGIATTVSLSRFRLTEAITQVFHLGLTSAITVSANAFTDTAIMQLDEDGKIINVDHADAIGWSESQLTGQHLPHLLRPRSHDQSVRQLEPGTAITSPMLNGQGGKFDARITVCSLGDDSDGERHIIASISPVIANTIAN